MFQKTLLIVLSIVLAAASGGCSCGFESHVTPRTDAGPFVPDDAGPMLVADAAPLAPDAYLAPDAFVPPEPDAGPVVTDAGPPREFSCHQPAPGIDHTLIVVGGNVGLGCQSMVTMICNAPTEEDVLADRFGGWLIHGHPSAYGDVSVLIDGVAVHTEPVTAQQLDLHTDPVRFPAGVDVRIDLCFTFAEVIPYTGARPYPSEGPRSGSLMGVSFTGGALEPWGAEYDGAWHIRAIGVDSGETRYALSERREYPAAGLTHVLRHSYPRFSRSFFTDSDLHQGVESVLDDVSIEGVGRVASVKKFAWQVLALHPREGAGPEARDCSLSDVWVERDGAPIVGATVNVMPMSYGFLVTLIFHDILDVDAGSPERFVLHGRIDGVSMGDFVRVSFYESGSGGGYPDTGAISDLGDPRPSVHGVMLPAPHVSNHFGMLVPTAALWSDASISADATPGTGSEDWTSDGNSLFSMAFRHQASQNLYAR